jgi:hypothetical protein
MDLFGLQIGSALSPFLGTLGDAVRAFTSGDAFTGKYGTFFIVAAVFAGYRVCGSLFGVILRLAAAVVRLFVAVPLIGATGILNDITALIQRLGGRRRSSLARPVAIALLAGGALYVTTATMASRKNSTPAEIAAASSPEPRCTGEIVDLTCP